MNADSRLGETSPNEPQTQSLRAGCSSAKLIKNINPQLLKKTNKYFGQLKDHLGRHFGFLIWVRF
jgi:hypothetical protein